MHLHTFSLFTIIFMLYILYLLLTYLASSLIFSAITTRRKQRLEPSDSQTLVSMLPGYCAVINLVIVRFHRKTVAEANDFVFEHLCFFFSSEKILSSTSISFIPVLLFSSGLRVYIALYSGVFGTSL